FSQLVLAFPRSLWAGIAFLPLVVSGGIRDLNGIGWGRALLLAILGGLCCVLISNTGFLLVPLGHGGVIQPSCAALGGLLLATFWLGEKITTTRAIGAVIIVCGLLVIGAESAFAVGLHGVAGDFIFVLTGLMFATFGILLRFWRISAMPATMVISVISLPIVPIDWALGGLDRMIAVGWPEVLLQAILQGVLAGPGPVLFL